MSSKLDISTNFKEETIEDDFSYFHLSKEGIAYTKFKNPKMGYDIALIKNHLSLRKKLYKNRKLPLINDSSTLTGGNIETVRFVSTADYLENITALALVQTFPIQRFLTNLFLKFRSQQIPTRIFKSVEEAEHWIKAHHLPNNS